MQNSYHLIKFNVLDTQVFSKFIERIEKECKQEAEPTEDSFHSIVAHYQEIESGDLFDRERIFDIGGLGGVYAVSSTAADSWKNKETKQMIKSVENLYERAKALIESIRNKTHDTEDVRKELVQIRLEILALKAHQLGLMITNLLQPNKADELKKNEHLIEEVTKAYTDCLQEMGVISGDLILSDQGIKKLFLMHMDSWTKPVHELEALYQNKISLEKKLRQTLFHPKEHSSQEHTSEESRESSREFLILRYDWAFVQLQIQSKEREILNRITATEVDQANLSRLRQENNTQTEAISTIMHHTSKEIKKKLGRAALEQIHQKKWGHSLWGEALKQRSQEIDFTAEDKDIVEAFSRKIPYFSKKTSFESEVNEMKDTIRGLKSLLDQLEEGETKEGVRKNLIEQQLHLYNLLYRSSLAIITEENRGYVQPNSDRFFKKIIQLLSNSDDSPNYFSSWIKENCFLKDQEITTFLINHLPFQKNLPVLFKELENLYKQNQVLLTLKEDSLEYLETRIEIKQSKLQILHLQRKLFKEMQSSPHSLFLSEKIQVRISKLNDASNFIARENEKLIREANTLFEHEYRGDEFAVVEGTIEVTNKKYPAPWILTSWGEILVENKSVFVEWANSFTELTNSYVLSVQFLQEKIDRKIVEIENKKIVLEKATEKFQEKKDLLLGPSVSVKTLSSTQEIDRLHNELTIQKMHLLQAHMDRTIELLGDRQSAINQWTKEILEKEKQLLREEMRNNPYSFGQITTAIGELKNKLKNAQEEAKILNQKFDESILEYERLQKELQTKFQIISFNEIIAKFAQDLVEQVLPSQLTSRIANSSEIRKRMQYARAGYSMIAEVSKLLTELSSPRSEEIGKPIFERHVIEVDKFIKWAKKHPHTASYLAGDIMQVLSILKQEGIAGQIESGLKTTLYTRALLNQLHQNVDEPIETEEDFRYKAIADLFKRMPAAAGTVLGAAQSLGEESGFNFQTLSKALWGAAKGVTLAKTAQNIRKFIPPDLEQTALIITQALQGKEIQGIIDDMYRLELANVGSGIIQKILKPMDIVSDIQDWWQKIQNAEKGLERTLRITTQIALPIISGITSIAIAYSTTRAGAPTAALLVGSAGSIGILVAAGLIGTIAASTLALMIISTHFIDLSTYGFKTYQHILEKQEERKRAYIEERLEERQEKAELEKKLKGVAARSYQDFSFTRLIPSYSYLELPEDMRVFNNETPASVRGLRRFHKLAAESLEEECDKEIRKFESKVISMRIKGRVEFLDTFHAYEIEKKLEKYLNKLFDEHIELLGRLREIPERMLTVPKEKKIKEYKQVSEYVKYEPIRSNATAAEIETVLTEKVDDHTQELKVRTHIDKLAKENERQLHLDTSLELCKKRKKELIAILLNNQLNTIYGKGKWLQGQVERIVKRDFYASWSTYEREAQKDPEIINKKRNRLKKTCKRTIEKKLVEKAVDISKKEAEKISDETLAILDEAFKDFEELAGD